MGAYISFSLEIDGRAHILYRSMGAKRDEYGSYICLNYV